MFERKLLKENKRIMVCDQLNAYNDKLFKQYEFIEVNNKMKEERKNQSDWRFNGEKDREKNITNKKGR